VVLEIDEDELVPIILGRPFLATARAVIDVRKVKLSLRVGSETVTFNIRKSMKSKHSRNDYLYCTDHTAKLDKAGRATQMEGPGESIKTIMCRTTQTRTKGITQTPLVHFPPRKQQLSVVISSVLSTAKKTRLLKVSPVQVIPKKGGMTIVKNEKDELIPQRTVTRWRMCIDYHKLNKATQKDQFPLPFIDQMLKRLAGHVYYCFIDGVRVEDQQTFQAHSLRQQNNERSTRELHYNREGTFGCRFHIQQILSILGLNQDHCFHGPLCPAIHDKKYVENLAADHISRLENPDLGKLTKAEIRNLFLEDQLMAISDKNNKLTKNWKTPGRAAKGTFGTVEWKAKKWNKRAFSCLFLENGIGFRKPAFVYIAVETSRETRVRRKDTIGKKRRFFHNTYSKLSGRGLSSRSERESDSEFSSAVIAMNSSNSAKSFSSRIVPSME
nr:RNA-directed DNA polymerase homolog [Tanacetum cinerariifolium]